MSVKIYSLRGIPSWLRIMTDGGADPCKHSADRSCQQPQRWANTSDKLSCPKCKAWRSLDDVKLRNRTGNAQIVCLTCKLKSRSQAWECACGIDWIVCETHSLLLPQLEEQRRRRKIIWRTPEGVVTQRLERPVAREGAIGHHATGGDVDEDHSWRVRMTQLLGHVLEGALVAVHGPVGHRHRADACRTGAAENLQL